MARVFSLSGRLKTLFDVLAFSFSLVAMSSSRIVTLSWPEAAAHPPVFPVFLPFSGCPVRCVFCAQDRQTGCAPRQAADALAVAGRQLRERAGRAHPAPELAFYGGTFTALPPEDFAACLIFARMARHEGLICGLRCSTRPDRLATDRLAALREAGCACVELGVQSFADDALHQSRRGYDGETARAACAAVRAAGMRVGVQLMPGMPGSRPARFLEDVRLALELGAACLRFYPCLVLEGTELAARWRAGGFRPWPLSMTLDVLAEALALAQRAGVPVIRMGLAPEAGLTAAVLAGPRHPALGARVQARCLWRQVARLLARARAEGRLGGDAPVRLVLPRRLQGMYRGHAGELAPLWARLGVTPARVRFHEGRREVFVERPDVSDDDAAIPHEGF